ncbi:MAG: metal-dependent hydrolase [Dehalococcoidales bacterium]|nr:metal-dependent hydrolase [Dehalococcoidales bacterium]
MLVFAHAGITLGAAAIVADTVDRKPSWFASLSRYVDIRWLLVGSLLPDIIDKPIGQYFFRDTYNNGRIFAHTLLFFIIISAIGFFLYKKRKRTWMLALAAGTFTHIILDEMWQTPQTLFWPLLGFSFPEEDLEGWAVNIWEALLSNPSIYIPEIVGLAVLLFMGIYLLKRRGVINFLKRGRVP